MGLRHVYILFRCFSTDFWSPCGRGGFLVILLFRRRAEICCEKGGRQWPTSLSAPGQMDRLGCVWRPPSCVSSIRVLRVSTVSSPVAILAHLSHATEDEESIHETLKLQSRSQIFWKILKNSPLSGHFAALPNNLRWIFHLYWLSFSVQVHSDCGKKLQRYMCCRCCVELGSQQLALLVSEFTLSIIWDDLSLKGYSYLEAMF